MVSLYKFNTIKKWVVLIIYLVVPQIIQATPSKYAMLVGVTDYPSLSQVMSLTGPANDVRAVSKMLKQKGFKSSNMQVYAENIPGSKSPTKKNIMDGLKLLAKKTNEESFVYLQFSGHGSQQPALENSDEADGRDEIFLPKDIGKWDDSVGKVKNAIVDNEIRDAIQNIRNTGAFVWVVFDSCHSGTMARGLIKMRRVDPFDPKLGLGIPRKKFELAKNRVISLRGNTNQEKDTVMRGAVVSKGKGKVKPGKMVAFYAAQSTESTPEMKLPRGADSSKQKTYGLFTYALLKAVGSTSHISYRQLSERIYQIYAELDWNGSRPLVEGNQDEGVFGEDVGKPVRQWELTKGNSDNLSIPAGSMHMLNEGAILAVVPSPTSLDDDVLGYLSASNVREFNSTLASVEKDKGYKRFDMQTFKWGQYARLVDSNIHYELKIFAKVSGNSHPSLNAVIKDFKKDGIEQVSVNWVDKAESADLRIMGKDRRVFLLSVGEDIDGKNVVSDEFPLTAGLHNPAMKSWLSSSIASIAKVKNLMALSTNMGSSFPGVEMKVVAQQKKTSQKIDIDSVNIPQLRDKDVISFEIDNTANSAMDITILFKDRNYGLTVVFPRNGDSNRIESMGKKTVKLGTINTKTTIGREGLIVIAVPAKKDAPRSDFTFLAQKSIQVSSVSQGVVGSKGVSRGRSYVAATRSLFESAGFNKPQTRGLTTEDSSEFQVRIFQWNTVK